MIAIESFEDGVQEVLRFCDPASGAQGFVVVDNTQLGPAMGGCRLWHYADDAAALRDAQRLARGMSYKNAMAGLPLGGGKTVVRRPDGPFDRDALFFALGHALNELAGTYVTAEDVGTTAADMQIVRQISPHVFGLPVEDGQPGGDPSPWTAKGVFFAIKAVSERYDRPLNDLAVAVQGLGSVGSALCELLLDAGARLVVSDISSKATARFANRASVEVVANAQIHCAEVDVFAPCALGAGLNENTIAQLGARWVIGAANNQLATRQDGDRMALRNILYIPDYVANAGGIINVAGEYFGKNFAWVERRVERIGQRVTEILDLADHDGTSPAFAADRLAQDLLGGKLPLDPANAFFARDLKEEGN